MLHEDDGLLLWKAKQMRCDAPGTTSHGIAQSPLRWAAVGSDGSASSLCWSTTLDKLLVHVNRSETCVDPSKLTLMDAHRLTANSIAKVSNHQKATAHGIPRPIRVYALLRTTPHQQ